ncbi:MAG: aminotransferase class III-fold pyridoxal phosphate-dependent enzyme, partial [Clostridia bacterium]|nr:aminotransferase class III-fold pyridoxal phosphate-dependent enzyme [Clostridia bacterium]
YNNVEALEQYFRNHGDTTAAVILEPVACNMGVVVPTIDFLKATRRLTAQYGAILIFDQSIHLFDVIELTDGGFLRLDRFVRGFFRRAFRLFDGSRTVRRSLRCRLFGLLRSHAGVRVFADFSVFSRQFACGVLQNFCVHFFLIQSKTSRIESCVDDLYGKCSAVQASQQCVGTQLR